MGWMSCNWCVSCPKSQQLWQNLIYSSTIQCLLESPIFQMLQQAWEEVTKLHFTTQIQQCMSTWSQRGSGNTPKSKVSFFFIQLFKSERGQCCPILYERTTKGRFFYNRASHSIVLCSRLLHLEFGGILDGVSTSTPFYILTHFDVIF